MSRSWDHGRSNKINDSEMASKIFETCSGSPYHLSESLEAEKSDRELTTTNDFMVFPERLNLTPC